MPNYSLGEIDALARKATRGAGYSWGLAEEAGKSVRWLSAYGFSGAEILANYLEMVANKSDDYIPSLKRVPSNNIEDENIQSETISFENNSKPLCPLYSGTLINDLGHQIKENKIFSFDKMLSPLLALSQTARVAEAYGISVSFTYGETEIVCNAEGIHINDSSVELVEHTPPLIGGFLQKNHCEGFTENVDSVKPRLNDDSSLSSKNDPKIQVEFDGISLDKDLSENYIDVVCSRNTNNLKATNFPSPQSRPISAKALKILELFAHSTYAPATEESRLKGAG